MARLTGPNCKLCRRIGDKLLIKGDRCMGAKCAVERRAVRAPKGGGPRRKRISDRGVQLREKQKARYTYGMLERQFRRFFEQAERQPGVTADNLLVLLERRLDNVVFRLGFADTRAQARQVVRHGHVAVNKRNCNVPSRLVRPGDTISWQETSRKTELFKVVTETVKGRLTPGWLSLEAEAMEGRVLSLPGPGEVDSRFDGKAIVEFYSK